ncbi:hypothetical protein DL93DRAFT_2097455 [Clavulina sp. PMI_390]|nr:hypothetical protein DL93DRAFT_2097455 [Clavulina sp. PMI_390]
MGQRPSKSSDLASHIHSFPDILPYELVSEIICRLSRKDLKSFALCSKASHELSVPYLWRRVRIQLMQKDGRRLTDFIRFFLASPACAAAIREICITWGISPPEGWWHGGRQADPQQGWARFRESLALLKNLQCLHLVPSMIDTTKDKAWLSLPPFSKEFYAALAQAPFAAWLTEFSFIGPSGPAIELLRAFRNVSSIEIPDLLSFSHLPDHTLSHLRRVCASMKLLSTLEGRGCLEHLEEGSIVGLKSIELKRFGDMLRGHHSLQKLHLNIMMKEGYPLTGNINPLRLLSHPSLQKLETKLFIPPWFRTDFRPEIVPSLIPLNDLLSLPSLTSVHITLHQSFSQKFLSFVGNKQGRDDTYEVALAPALVEDIKLALRETLVSGPCPKMLKEVRISLGEVDECGKVVASQFTARKDGAGQWGITVWCAATVSALLQGCTYPSTPPLS